MMFFARRRRSLPFCVLLLVCGGALVDRSRSCTSFYCINSCGCSPPDVSKCARTGFKLILANNRDENVYRPTKSVDKWPQTLPGPYASTQVYGPLDLAVGVPPEHYSTWLGINEHGTVANILVHMQPLNATHKSLFSRGLVPTRALIYSSTPLWRNASSYIRYLNERKSDYKSYNYVQLDLSASTGLYTLHYTNNVDNLKSSSQMNTQAVASNNSSGRFIFGLSNSSPERPFKKVVNGKRLFEQLIEQYELDGNKTLLVYSLIHRLLQNKTANYPDESLDAFFRSKSTSLAQGVSQLNADYKSNVQTRTSTVILVDYGDNVDYYEYNLTSWSRLNATREQVWKMKHLQFQLSTSRHNHDAAASIAHIAQFDHADVYYYLFLQFAVCLALTLLSV